MRVASALLAPLLLLSAPCRPPEQERDPQAPSTPVRRTEECRVTRITDGDTLSCEKQGSIRLIGIDAPERNEGAFYAASTQALGRLVKVGERVQLEPDVEDADRFGRPLRYVWKGGAMVNWRLVRTGFAVAYRFPPNVQYADAISAAMRAARAEEAGLWAEGAFECTRQERRQKRC